MASVANTTNGTIEASDFPKPTAHSVSLAPSLTPGIYHHSSLTGSSALKASQLLNQNHINHHVFFNKDGFHNHIAHHLFSLYSVNASPTQLQTAYDHGASYQRPQFPVRPDVVQAMQSTREKVLEYMTGESKKCGNQERNYTDFMEFWAQEAEKRGVKGVLEEWIFKGDKVAEKLLGRLFAGFVHPLIHLGFGLEYHQPAILAEALAQACVHDNWIYPYLSACETSAAKQSASTNPPRSLISLLHEARSNSKILNSVRNSDGNKVRDGVLTRAFPETVALASQWTVQPTQADLEKKTAEMIVADALFTGAAAFHHENNREASPIKKDPRVDFFYMHSMNASIFFSSFLEDPDVSSLMTVPQKARLLQMKGWFDIAMYISRGCAVIDPKDIQAYEPKSSKQGAEAWSEIFSRVASYEGDDGHAVKLVRALANGERVAQKYENEDWCVVRGDMWVKLGHLVVDSINRCGERSEGGGPLWVRNAGFEEAWRNIPDRKVGEEKL